MELAARPAGEGESASSFGYMTVGHVTVDVIGSESSRRPGGGAFYSALQASRLGLRTLILTQGSAAEIEALLEPYRGELELRVLPAAATTTLQTAWSGVRRTQQVLAWAGPITGTVEADTEILHFAPVARETTGAWSGRVDFVGITPQGLARAWESDGVVATAPLPRDRISLDALLPKGCSAVVVSEHERRSCAPLLDAAAATGAVVAITAGAGATSVQLPGGETIRVPAPRVGPPRDDLGAGDVFAAAFFVALREGRSPLDAATFGNAAASLRILGAGANAIGERSAIESRMP